MDDIFHPDLSTDPYWWLAAPPTADGSSPVPDETDVAIVGSGYTGLNAAIELADRGFKVTVLEAKEFGHGASTRSGGHVSSGLNLGKGPSAAKPSPLISTLGQERYNGLLDEASQSMDRIQMMVERENIDCHLTIGGRFVAAFTRSHYDSLVAKMPVLDHDGKAGCRMVPRERQREEIGTDYYHGGMVVERSGKLHPALYYRGLLDACRRRPNITLCAYAPVTSIEAKGSGFRVTAGKAELRAADVLLSTNGYSQEPSPWLKRRVIPLASCIIATEELQPELMKRLIVNNRSINDTKRVLTYYRASPDGKRIIFGGRETFFTQDPLESGRRLYARMLRLYPELAGVRVTHSWTGMVAMTFDHLPHIGRENGIYYAAGCNGSGVAMMSYLGYRIGATIAGANDKSAFDGLPFPTKPMYTGKTWFLPAVGAYFKTMDKWDRMFG